MLVLYTKHYRPRPELLAGRRERGKEHRRTPWRCHRGDKEDKLEDIIDVVVGSVTGFLSLLGGLWAQLTGSYYPQVSLAFFAFIAQLTYNESTRSIMPGFNLGSMWRPHSEFHTRS